MPRMITDRALGEPPRTNFWRHLTKQIGGETGSGIELSGNRRSGARYPSYRLADKPGAIRPENLQWSTCTPLRLPQRLRTVLWRQLRERRKMRQTATKPPRPTKNTLRQQNSQRSPILRTLISQLQERFRLLAGIPRKGTLAKTVGRTCPHKILCFGAERTLGRRCRRSQPEATQYEMLSSRLN